MGLTDSTRKFRKTKKGVLTNLYNKQIHRSIKKGVPVPAYSLTRLHELFLNDNKFNRLFNEWVSNGYNKQFKPTIDRISCKLPYTEENIQVLSWADNRYKQRMETNIFRATPIVQKMGDLVIREFKSVKDAVIKTSLSQGNISSCLTGKRKTCGGYNWEYKSQDR